MSELDSQNFVKIKLPRHLVIQVPGQIKLLQLTFVFKHKGKLRPDLAPKCEYFSQKCSEKAEKEHFNLLKAQGYIVKGGR